MKLGIVVPFSWSFWGAVVEHAELQAAALRERGHDVRLIMGNDPPGQFTRVLHPRVGRHGEPPPEVIPIGRSVIVPANGSLPNIILSPRSILRMRRVLEAEGFDLLHLHEPMTPTPCIAALAMWDGPMVGTHHASGDLGWMRLATPVWGFLEERLDRRIAVSEQARDVGAALASGRVRDRPERRPDPGRRRAGRTRAPRRLRRAPGVAEGAARAPARVAGGAEADRRAAPDRRRRPARGPAPARRGCASPTTASTCSASSARRT